MIRNVYTRENLIMVSTRAKWNKLLLNQIVIKCKLSRTETPHFDQK